MAKPSPVARRYAAALIAVLGIIAVVRTCQLQSQPVPTPTATSEATRSPGATPVPVLPATFVPATAPPTLVPSTPVPVLPATFVPATLTLVPTAQATPTQLTPPVQIPE